MKNLKASFNAPWGNSLKGMTTLSVLILTSIPLIGIFSGARNNIIWIVSMIVTPLAILFIATFFVILGYSLTGNMLLIQRLGWTSKLNLTDLQSAKEDPEAMSRSIRTFGNGGLFCFAGSFRNKKLGPYRAFATDPRRSVVLKFSNRIIVVTPDNPKKFVAEISEIRNLNNKN